MKAKMETAEEDGHEVDARVECKAEGKSTALAAMYTPMCTIVDGYMLPSRKMVPAWYLLMTPEADVAVLTLFVVPRKQLKFHALSYVSFCIYRYNVL